MAGCDANTDFSKSFTTLPCHRSTGSAIRSASGRTGVCGVTPAHNEFLGGVFVKPKVYFTKTVTPEKVIEMYKQLDCKLPGNVAI